MAQGTSALSPAQRYPTSKILLAGLITIVVSVALNYVVYWIATGLFGIQSDFAPFVAPATFGIFTVGFLIVAIAVWWWIARRSATPEKTFNTVALVALILSIIPNIAFLFVPPPPQSGSASVAAMIVLIIMHVVAWLVTITVLPRFSRA
jgi:hypothetical protein